MKQKAILFAAIMAAMSLPGCYMGNERASTQSDLAPQRQASLPEQAPVEQPAVTQETKAPTPEKQDNPVDDEHQKAVGELRSHLAKIDGMKTGSKEFYSFSYKYLEKENVFEHKWKQSIVPKEAADQEVLRALKQEGIKNEKTIIKGTELMNLMLPLKPTIRCIVYYPDDTEMFRVSFPFNELYLDN